MSHCQRVFCQRSVQRRRAVRAEQRDESRLDIAGNRRARANIRMLFSLLAAMVEISKTAGLGTEEIGQSQPPHENNGAPYPVGFPAPG